MRGDYVSRNVYTMSHVSEKLNMADMMTKAQAVAVFITLLQA